MRLLELAVAVVLVTPLAAQRLIGIDSARGVWQIDTATGARTSLGVSTANAGVTGGLAYDAATGRLWCTSTSQHELFTLDVTNWAATAVGPFGPSMPFMHGIEWDPSTQTLYGHGSSAVTGGLYTLDPATGAATFVGASGLTAGVGFPNLGSDPTQNVLWMTHATTDSLYSVDRATGTPTLVGPLLGPTGPTALAFDTDDQKLYLTCNLTNSLYTIDTATGQTTFVGAMGQGNMLGLAYIPGAGRLTRAAHACGPTTIRVTGHPAIGATIATELGDVVGIPLIGYGITTAGLPFCGCTIGHEWAATVIGSSSSFTIPPNPGLVGVQLSLQGADIAGIGGCQDPPLTLTDTITVTIG